MRLRYVLPVLVVAGLAVLLAFGLTRNPGEIPSALIGQPMPAFDLPRLADPDAHLSERDLSGQVALLNVWASWCLGCREEHPLLAELARRGDVPIYGLNYKDDRKDAQRWLARYGNLYVANGYDPAGKVGIDWGVAAVPETFVIDRRGIIRHKQVGAISREDLENELLPLIGRLKAESAS